MSRSALRTEGASVGEALSAAVASLERAGVGSPRLDAELLLASCTGADRAELVARPEARLTDPQARRFADLVARRVQREPVAYILGSRGFRRLELHCDGRALIPRPETETLVDAAIDLASRWGAPDGSGLTVLDVGTGSGAVALAVCDELPGATVTATDLSAEALSLAATNRERLGLTDRLQIERGSVPAGRAFDLVVANLPYVADRDWAGLEPELTAFEPREALLGGPDGLDPIRDLLTGRDGIRGLARLPRGIALEVGIEQASEVGAMVSALGYGRVEIETDLAGIERVVIGERSA